MATEKDLFTTPPFLKELDLDKMLLRMANQEDMATIIDLNAYIKIVNMPKTKTLKSAEGPDLQAGGLGDPVHLKTDSGWLYSYHLAKEDSPAWLELSSSALQEVRAMAPSVEKMTHQAKTFRAAVEVVDFLMAQGWDKFSIEEGTPLMSWACWAYLTHLKQKVGGYKPDEFDQVRLDTSEELFEGVAESIAQLQYEASPVITVTPVSGPSTAGGKEGAPSSSVPDIPIEEPQTKEESGD